MKKTITLVVLCLCALMAQAQDFGVWESLHQGHSNRPDFITLLGRKIQQFRASREKLPWVKQVEKQLYQSQPHGLIGLKLDVVHSERTPTVPTAIAWLYQKRTQTWKNAMDGNSLLKRFTITTPRPTDVANMSENNVLYLLHFLQNSLTVQTADKHYLPTDVQTYQRYLVRVTLQAPGEKFPVHLIFNCYTHEMYISYDTMFLPKVPLTPLSSPKRGLNNNYSF